MKIETEKDKRKFVLLLGMIAKIAKASGTITKDEMFVIRIFLKRYNFNDETLLIVSKGFNKLKWSKKHFAEFATEYHRLSNKDSKFLFLSILEILFRIATKNGALHPIEKQYLQIAKYIFEISDIQYDNLARIYIKEEEKKVAPIKLNPMILCYSVLGCAPNNTDKELKKKYRQLISKAHPDKIIAKGLPKQFIDIANKRFNDIQEAYNEIMRYRSMTAMKTT